MHAFFIITASSVFMQNNFLWNSVPFKSPHFGEINFHFAGFQMHGEVFLFVCVFLSHLNILYTFKYIQISEGSSVRITMYF